MQIFKKMAAAVETETVGFCKDEDEVLSELSE